MGADAILFVPWPPGGAPRDRAKPNEAMLDEALMTGTRIALLATFGPSLPSMQAELEQLAAERKATIEIRTREVPAALAA